MTDFFTKKLPCEHSSLAELVLIGKQLKRINFYCLIDPKFPVRVRASSSDIFKSCLALL